MNQRTITTPLAPGQTLAQLEAIIDKGKETFEQVGWAIAEVLDRKLYRDQYKTFNQYCQERWGWSREHGYRLARAAKFVSEQKQLAEKSGEPAQAISNEAQARALIKQGNALIKGYKEQQKAIVDVEALKVARKDPEQSIQMGTPAVVESDKLPPDAITMIGQAARLLDKLMRSGTFVADPDFRHVAALIHKVKEIVQPEFNFARGLTKQKCRGTREQVVEFCVNLKLPKTDGDWFFDKAEGCGWKNNGAAIVDWRATVRAWQAAKVFPSQKAPGHVNGQPNGNNGKLSGAEMVLRTKELEMCESEINTIRHSYDSHQSMRQPDRERIMVLKTRRAELRGLLGIKI